MLIPLLALGLSFAFQTPTDSNLNKGTSLFASCKAHIRVMDKTYKNLDDDYAESQYCLGYVEGFTTGDIYGGGSLCFKEATAGTLVRVYVAYMERHPKLLDEDKYVGLADALIDSYRCKAQK
jgi:hypothetical protein